MTSRILFCSLIMIYTVVSCSQQQEKKYQKPQKVIIAGKVLNIDSKKTAVKLNVNRPGFAECTSVVTKADSLGNFKATFETYTPTDVWLSYKMNILVLVRPGDSIYVEFNGKPRRRPNILKTIKFSGDAARQNHDAAIFQRMYFSSPLYTDWQSERKAIKLYDADRYLNYLDSIREEGLNLYQEFIQKVSPDNEVRAWALTFIERDYFDLLGLYPFDHQIANNLSRNDKEVPLEYYEPFLKGLPVTETKYISGYALSDFVNRFKAGYATNNLWNEDANQKYVYPNGIRIGPTEIMDSLKIFGLLKYTPDTILRQMVLTEKFAMDFKKADIETFEKYRYVAEKYIQEPFLREPLFKLYRELKKRLENPKVATSAVLKEASRSSVGQIMDSILYKNKGKVIYVDVWATWCGPCLAEMPNSRKLMEQLKYQDVAFVYLCIESDNGKWKALVDKYSLGGEHYLLSNEQSIDLRQTFKIKGVPHYFLIDKKGTIVEQGWHLKPDLVKDKIGSLLNEGA